MLTGVACPMVLTGVGKSIAGAEEQPINMAMGTRITSGSTKERALRTSHFRSAALWIPTKGVSERVTFWRRTIIPQPFASRIRHLCAGTRHATFGLPVKVFLFPDSGRKILSNTDLPVGCGCKILCGLHLAKESSQQRS